MFIFTRLPLIFASLFMSPIADAKSVGKHHSKGKLFSSIMEEQLPAGTPQSPITIHDEDSLFTVTSAVASRTVMLPDEESSAMTLVRLDNEHPTFLTMVFTIVNASFKQSVKAELTFAQDGNSATYSYFFDSFDKICKPAGSDFDCALSHHLTESIGPIRLPKASSLPDWAQSGILSGHFKVSAGPTSGTADIDVLEMSFYALVVE